VAYTAAIDAGIDRSAAEVVAQAAAAAAKMDCTVPAGYMDAAQMAVDGSRLEAARAAGSAVTLAVRMDGMVEPATLEVPLYSTVAELKRRISSFTGNLLPPGRMALLSEAGQLMADGTLLTDYRARNGSVVSLYIMAREEPQDVAAVAAAEAEAEAYHQQALAIQRAMADAAQLPQVSCDAEDDEDEEEEDEDEEDEEDDRGEYEIDPSGRAKCVVCGNPIIKGDMRVRAFTNDTFANTPEFYHPACWERYASS
jgi:hypothetical protein